MTKECLLKFRNDVDKTKRENVLNVAKVLNYLDTFGIYMVSLQEENILALRKDEDILYVKETKK